MLQWKQVGLGICSGELIYGEFSFFNGYSSLGIVYFIFVTFWEFVVFEKLVHFLQVVKFREESCLQFFFIILSMPVDSVVSL